ncbi:MAG: trypsin-like peptidase domain-containing protein [Robiginitomaculum sp.]
MNILRLPFENLKMAFGCAVVSGLLLAPVNVQAKPLGMPGEEGLQQGLPKSLANLIEHVAPAVVNIKVVTGGAAAGHPDQDETEGQGSGFIVTDDGMIVTNYHVIKGGDKITVDFANGEVFVAKLIGTDRETDLAVIQIQSNRTFDHVVFRQGKKVRIGDWVLAIGNPFGIGQSSSIGIISAVGRERVDSGSYVDYMQTDATVNRGNSGGPLFDFSGRVVGVNSAIYSPTGASVGIAFVIPYDLAERIVTELMREGEINRGFLGVGLREAEYQKRGVIYKGGATVESIGVGSPADLAGFKVEDIILSVNEKTVRNAVDATRAIGDLRAGNMARFKIERGEQVHEIQVQIGNRPQDKNALTVATGRNTIVDGTTKATPPPSSSSTLNTGLSLVDLSATFRDSIGMRSDQVGVYVDAVAPGSNAARKGIKSGMVILEANSKPVATVSVFRQIVVTAQKSGQRSLVLLVRTINGSETYTSISLN